MYETKTKNQQYDELIISIFIDYAKFETKHGIV